MSSNGVTVKPASNPFLKHRLPLGIRLFLIAASVMFRITGALSTKLAGRIALRLFMTPPKHPVPKRELSIRDSGSLKTYEINGETIAVRSWGEGPAVLLSHGWGGRGTQFFALIEALAQRGYRAVAFDAPAHGDSSGKRTNMLQVTQTLAAVAEREGPISAVIGHSFGCGTALLAIDRYQLPSDKVVLFSCFRDTLWITEQFAAAFGMSEKVISTMRDIAMQRFAGHFESPWDWLQLSPLNTIKRVEGDLLLIHDRNDVEVPYSHAESLMEIVPDAELLTTRKLGHKKILMNRECIEACIKHISHR